MAKYTIYLIGYGNQVPDEFLERLELGTDNGYTNGGCLVVDVRARRRSWAWSYTGPQTELIIKKAGHDYIWLNELGNVGNRYQVELDNKQVGLWALERLVRHSKSPVVLMCAELLSSNCHRRLVAEMLAERLHKAGDNLEIRKL